MEKEEKGIECATEEDTSEEPLAGQLLALSEALMARTSTQSKIEPKGNVHPSVARRMLWRDAEIRNS